MAGRRARITILSLATLGIAGLWAFQRRPLESPTHWAYRLCPPCGLEDAEIAQLIDDARHSGPDRAAMLELWANTFRPTDAHHELCRPCTEAVLDAAEAE